MKLEIIWLIVPICAFLSQLGGSDYAPKSLRRIAVPALMAIAAWYFAGFTWNIIPMAIMQWGAFTLPFTLIGDGVPGKAVNWLWLPLWGVLVCSPSLWLNLSVWPAVGVLGLVLGLLGALSNIKATAKYFQWKFIEMFISGCPAACLALSLTIQ